jgi:hypothetical protein
MRLRARRPARTQPPRASVMLRRRTRWKRLANATSRLSSALASRCRCGTKRPRAAGAGRYCLRRLGRCPSRSGPATPCPRPRLSPAADQPAAHRRPAPPRRSTRLIRHRHSVGHTVSLPNRPGGSESGHVTCTAGRTRPDGRCRGVAHSTPVPCARDALPGCRRRLGSGAAAGGRKRSAPA